MKKISAVLILLFITLSLWAQEEPPPDASPETSTQEEEAPKPQPKKKFAMKNRIFELSLINMDISFSNSSFTAGDFIRAPNNLTKGGKFFKDSISFNLNDLFEGFSFHFGAIIEPLSLNFNWKDKWGVGLDIGHINATGNLLFSGNLMSLISANDDKFGPSGAVFTDIGVPVFFHLKKLRIKIRPSVFLPLIYAEPGITYSYSNVVNPDTGVSGIKLQVNYDMRVYSPVDMQKLGKNDSGAFGQDSQYNVWDIVKNNTGYDLSLGAEYPLLDRLDLGVDIINIPLVMASLNHYMSIDGEAYIDSSKIDLAGLINGEDLPEDAYGYPKEVNIKYKDDGSIKIFRPFTMLSYAKYRPFKSPVLSLIPSIGFSISSLYTQLCSVEGGLSVRLDLANLFITTIGINYNDRKWKNSLDIVLNLRAFELDLGISFQSPNFLKSFQGAGLGLAAGLKFGW
jgi:hypothetical protein